MRTVITFKNHCLKHMENEEASKAAASAGAKKSGGYNPLVPNPKGGFIGDIHIGKFDDLLNVFDPSSTRRFIASPQSISFSYDYNGKAMLKEFASNEVEIML